MNSFHVWSRPVGDFCHIRVEGLENARWLLARLSQSFVFKTFEPFGEEKESTICTFQVPYNPPLSRTILDGILAAIPQVLLSRERT